MWNLTEEQTKRYNALYRKIHSVDGYNTLPTTEEVKEFEKLVQITRKGGRRPSKKRSARRRRSSKARKSRKSRATRRK